ncbi:MAG: acyl-CoA thioesterase [Bdellovibrionales bacterium]|nr:acyl-CoA thioesterase [Bdellovibrionales bacterium]
MTQLVLPSHTNSLGSLFGGTLMSWIDIAAAISAQRHSSRPVVTASIDDVHFIAPVFHGWVVNIEAQVNYVGKTSMEVGVHVVAENPITSEKFYTTKAFCTFVALDDHGQPMGAPPLVLESEEDKRRHDEAQQRRKWRLERKEQFVKK